jgi:hypothetical protein
MLALIPVALLLATPLTVDRTIPDEPGRDPLAPAQAGLVQCYDPDLATHSCRLIAAYTPARDGTWIKVATVMPDPTQHLTVDIETPVAVRDGAVCGTFRRDQVMGAKLHYFGKLVPADHAIPLLAQIAAAMAGAFDREICTRFVPVGGVLVARPRFTTDATILPDQRVIWVRPDSGYSVQPRGGRNG